MRLIDADELTELLNWTFAKPPFSRKTVKKMIDMARTIDAVPVVRCKDCKFLRFTGTVWKCQNRLVMMLCEPNDYCSRAERKEE